MTDLFHLNASYCGYLAQQCWADFAMWEELLNDHPEIDAIFEIGTGVGGFALYLSHQARARGLGFTTFDRAQPSANLEGFIRADVFGDDHSALLAGHLRRWKSILHCDGDDKPREVATFGPHLRPSSLAVVHDWGHEFLPEHIPDYMQIERYGLLSVVLRKAAV